MPFKGVSKFDPIRDELIAFYQAGNSLSECGTRFGFSGASIRNYLEAIGIERRSYRDSLAISHGKRRKIDPGYNKGRSALAPHGSKVIHLYESGMPPVEIGEKFGVTVPCVRKYLEDNGVVLRTRSESMKLAFAKPTKRAKFTADPGPYRCIEDRAKQSVPETQTSEAQATFGFLSDEPARFCRKCEKSVPESGWSKMTGSRRSSYCKACFNQTYNSLPRPLVDDATKAKYLENAKVKLRELRQEVFVAYGNKCACCGETHPEFFAIDHVLGGGNRHRAHLKSIGINTTAALYAWLKKHGFPPEFRILCANCNSARAWYGYCPHEEQRSFLDVAKRETLWKRKLRLRLIEGYGGRCACCGETAPEFLALDHVNGGGSRHHKELRETHNSNTKLYHQIIKDGFPPEYRILCHSCNSSRGHHGYCPHIIECSTETNINVRTC